MIRPDAHTDFEIIREHPEMDGPGLDFPLPVQGNQSPNILALGMLAKISFHFGAFMLLIRLIGLSHPDPAVILSYVFAAAFAVAFGIKWFAPERGMKEWPVWIGAALVLFFAVSRYVPGSVLRVPLPDGARPQSALPLLLQAGIVLLVLVIYLSPSVKNLLSTKTRGPLAMGSIGCLIGGRTAALGYAPESDFGAWNYFGVVLVVAVLIILCVTDQYVRFEKATNPSAPLEVEPPRWMSLVPLNYGLGILWVPICFWVGNTVFLATLHLPNASGLGIFAFLVSLGACAIFNSLAGQGNPFTAAWDAVTFWLTYNLQRNSNPNVFQCLPWFREPLIRFGLLGAAVTALSLSLLHLSGAQAAKGRNKETAEQEFSFFWRNAPQNHPSLVAKIGLSKEAKTVYDRISDSLAKTGDVSVAPKRSVHDVGNLLLYAAVFVVGGPLLFLLLIVATQGAFIAFRTSNDANS